MKLNILTLLLLSLFLQGVNAFGQKTARKVIITGHVTDTKGAVVAGAMIFVDKINTNQVTDKDGFYRIKIKSDARDVTAFSVNAGAGKTQFDGNPVVDIVVGGAASASKTPNDPESGEKVNVGYGEIKRKDMTSPVSSIDATDRKFASYNNIYDMIKGQVPGVEVKGKSIRIQGANSFLASTEPLFVVDGMVVPSIDDINTVDVKSIEVLKGSAAAIYGSRGANGVILITLKSARDKGK